MTGCQIYRSCPTSTILTTTVRAKGPGAIFSRSRNSSLTSFRSGGMTVCRPISQCSIPKPTLRAVMPLSMCLAPYGSAKLFLRFSRPAAKPPTTITRCRTLRLIPRARTVGVPITCSQRTITISSSNAPHSFLRRRCLLSNGLNRKTPSTVSSKRKAM